ncbi:stabilin-1 isoform X2 [Scleropages formosus]|uniref:stabilin-1 isoform X2 n=1 Tax=Scleropages formosus TaxID=113540 RepID=UPI0010FABA8E|nr:stabilin-1-like isoform X2 [Scleropages formosus]
MRALLVLGLMASFGTALQGPSRSRPGRCDEPRAIGTSSVCTSCAAIPAARCPPGFTKTSENGGVADCSYSVEVGGRLLLLAGCRHTCDKVQMEQRCCKGFWGSSCLPCPTWQGRTCNDHGRCNDGLTGNGSCTCEDGFAGFACQKGPNRDATGGHGGPGVCSPDMCDSNAECTSQAGRDWQCTCKAGYQGDGQVCIPMNPCSWHNGDCPPNSTTCVYVRPGQSTCVCRGGMEGPDPSSGCSPEPPCARSVCETSAQCEGGPDGLARCVCEPQELPDGTRCYGNIMERLIDLDRRGQYMGKLSGAVTLFGNHVFTVVLVWWPSTGHCVFMCFSHHFNVFTELKGVFSDSRTAVCLNVFPELLCSSTDSQCRFTVSKHGPFTAFVPLLASSLPRSSETFLCKQHLILGQHLLRDLRGRDWWTFGGEAVRFEDDKFFLVRDRDALYSVVHGDIPAANGIIHLIDAPVANAAVLGSVPHLLLNETIGEMMARDPKFRGFLSLVEKCEALLPLRNPGSFTVFAPTNDAVDRFQEGTVAYVSAQAQRKLRELLRHHILSSAALRLDQLSSMSHVHSMANQAIRISISADGRLLLGEEGFPLGGTDIVASNGIVHFIDGVLVPPKIQPFQANRCDVTESSITAGSCVRCDHLPETRCPPGSTELGHHMKDCEYETSPSSSIVSRNGCAKLCNVTRTRAECCRGFYGPDCTPCPGGFRDPCHGKGTCLDGIAGNGTCSCASGFTGVECRTCAERSKHGERCDEECRCVHGVCDNRPGSRGVCRRDSCREGYDGELCDQTVKPCDSDGTFELCHLHANCMYSGLHTTCACMPGYEGDGRSCTPLNPCLQASRGMCDINAQCLYAAPDDVSCMCNEGWTGNGFVCVEVNNCLLENRGGCHRDADCLTVGPGQSECVCKRGYMGDGKACDPINPCLLNNGGCHALAFCEVHEGGTHTCLCPDGYGGDGITCFGSILAELSGNSDFHHFYRWIKMSSSLNLRGNATALVPSKDALDSLENSELQFWTDPRRLPYLLGVHFLQGAFTLADLRERANEELPTLDSHTTWGVKNTSGEVMLEDATILIPDIPATNGYIHVIDKVLRPVLSVVPPVSPPLMELLNHTPTFSLFRQAALLYNLTSGIHSKKYTILIPSDDAIEEYTNGKNVTMLDEDVFKYHVIPSQLVYPDKLAGIVVMDTLLGPEYQVMFHTDSENRTLVNEVLINGNVTETRNGLIMGISQVLEIHRNRCDEETFSRANDHVCCPGYFGFECFKCPGRPGEWCSGHGRCQDGIFGSGDCLCFEGFHGTACESCEPGRYGYDCQSVCYCDHGKCLDGINGTGQCLCYKDWKGSNCSEEVGADACGGLCDVNANCIPTGPGSPPTCMCVAGYHGNGTYCQEIDLCEDGRGGCSEHADCTKNVPGERACTCHEGYTGDGVVCLEIDGCLENNGGCHEAARCYKTGPNRVGCTCAAGYSGNGHQCEPINPCKTENGGCDSNAYCNHTGPGQRSCACLKNFVGDGLTCRGSLAYEVKRHPDASWLHKRLWESKTSDLKGKGPFTVFVPHGEYIKNFSVEPWLKRSCLGDLLRYHMVGCKELLESELRSHNELISLSGHRLRLAVREGALYINEESKIIWTDFITSTGVMHFIDRVLVPYDLMNQSTWVPPTVNVTVAAEAHGYTMFSKLLKEADLMAMVENSLHQPFTMLWPTDAAFHSLPEQRKRWLYSEEHRDKLVAQIKAHIIGGIRLSAGALPGEGSLRTMFGSTVSFSCDRRTVGDILVDDGNARILERHLFFNAGIAHGIDQLLEPPNLGARCDHFEEIEFNGPYSSCNKMIRCPPRSRFTGKILSGLRSRPSSWVLHGERNPILDQLPRRFRKLILCRRRCVRMQWLPRCCRNHYGRDCQVCPGGLQAPCGNHGLCNDTMEGLGQCHCDTGFTGTACERCKAGHYGVNCTACPCSPRGRCMDGLDGDGSCFCQEGWTGEHCRIELGMQLVCAPPCHPNAACRPGNTCECESLYEGDGRNCTALDLCGDDNGGCHPRASCTQTGVHVTCSCPPGYAGDGYSCSPINRCVQEENGGCSSFATCLFTGPNESVCQCRPGYVGDGIQCLEKVVPPVHLCLEDNGGCDPNAQCQDLHFQERTAGVFHVRSPAGKYRLNYSEARVRCHEEHSTLATLSQVSDAQQLGMHLCALGWMEGPLVGHPVTSPSASCGNSRVGVVMSRSSVNLSSTFDAYCYREKDVLCVCGHGYVGNGFYCNGDLASVMATSDGFSTFYSLLLSYANSSVDGQSLVALLSSRSAYVTLFLPQNAGFPANETLSWRDIEYHVSANNSVLLYDDLQQDLPITSRLGCNLTVDILSTNTTMDMASHIPRKRLNRRLIVEWDIPAINGIIHVIEAPLKAPPAPVSSDRSSFWSQPAVVLSAVLVTMVIAAMAFYFLKYRSESIHFQHFQNEDESTPYSRRGNPSIMCIRNPVYSTYSTITEPFTDSPDVDPSAVHHICD